MSLDGGKTLVNLPVTTRATTTLTGLAPARRTLLERVSRYPVDW
jgi:hypothetical protein